MNSTATQIKPEVKLINKMEPNEGIIVPLSGENTLLAMCKDDENSVIASQVVSPDGYLALGDIPLDLGLSKLLNTDDKHVVLSDGSIVALTGTDDDIICVTQDFNFRSRHMIINAYASGVNLLRLREYLINTCGYSPKQFREKVTALTNYSWALLDQRMKIAASYSREQMEVLAEAGATQTTALFLLKASPEKREEVLSEAREGLSLSKEVVGEILGTNNEDDDEDEGDDEDDDIPAKPLKRAGSVSTQSSSSTPSKTAKSVESKLAQQSATNITMDVAGSFTNYANLVTDVKDFTPQNIALEQRFNNLIAEIEAARTKHELSTVRGLAIRGVMTNMLSAVYGIEKPPEIESDNEPEWVKALREKLPKNVNRQFKSLFIMAFVDGHLGAINGEKQAPTAYEGLIKGKTLKREGVDALYELWAEGYAQGKLALEAQNSDA